MSIKNVIFISGLITGIIILIVSGILTDRPEQKGEPRIFQTSFESVDDFKDFYIVPQNYKNSSTHELSSENVHSGSYSHKAWIYDTNEPSTIILNNNHRAYPTVQLYKTQGGSYKTPVMITFWVWLDVNLSKRSPENEWFSFATLTQDTSDKWSRAVLVNLDYRGFVHLMHVPDQGRADRIFQTENVTFPMRQWVEIKIYADFARDSSYLKVWQDGILVSHARVNGGTGYLTQAHFGLYAPPSLSRGMVYNDDLMIREVNNESE